MPSEQSPQSTPQPKQPRRPVQLFEVLPSIKVITPPKGQYSPQVDERCFTYCSQSVAGRINRREPYCRSVCIRNVFLHEVQNVISFKRHANTDAKGNAKYPLPLEGQPRPSEDEAEDAPKGTQFWEPGYYIWVSKDTTAARRKFETLRLPLSEQENLAKYEVKRRETWNAYQEYLKKLGQPTTRNGEHIVPEPTAHGTADKDKAGDDKFTSASLRPAKFWHPPPRPINENPDDSKLVRVQLPIPALYKSLANLLAPSQRLLGHFKESIVSGEQRQFWMRVWDKAFTKEPFVLASRTLHWSWEKWKDGPPEAESES